MVLEIRKMELRFTDGEPSLYYNDKFMGDSSVFGYVYNQGPPHDHNIFWKDGIYLEDLPMEFFDGINRKVSVIVLRLCPIHIGKDCLCESLEIMPRTHDGKIILDLYNMIFNDGTTEYYFQ